MVTARNVPLPDLMDAAVQESPYDLYARLRTEAPIHRMPREGFYLVTSYDLVRDVIRQPDLFASGVSPMALRPGGVPQSIVDIYTTHGWLPNASCSTSDPPAHTRIRRALERLFTAQRVRALTPAIDAIAHELIDGFGKRTAVEFVRDFAHPLPMIVIADQLGVPRNDLAKFKLWSDAIVEPFSMMVSAEREHECARLVVEMQRYFAVCIEERREVPGNDLISAVVHADPGDLPAFDMRDLLTIITIDLLASGNETTTAAIASGMRLLIDRPELEARLREGDALGTFTEEVLRLESPAQGMFRRVTRDTVLGGVSLRAGDLLSLRFGAANRDERQFEHADSMDLDRRQPGRHLAFGVGRHHCIGAALARQEITSAFRALVARLRNFRATPRARSPRHAPSFFGRNLMHLHVSFDRIH